MRSLITLLVLLLLVFNHSAHAASRNLMVTGSAAQEQKRVALVIGNAAYQGASALRNPVNDAKAMSDALNRLGFQVIEVTDATQKEMNRAITAFGKKLNTETAALFFYAGHGLQVKGKNYIIPVDAQIEAEAAVASEAVSVDAVLEQLNVSSVSIVILDACRNNPFERSFRKMGGGGLAQMDAPKGSFIAYATAPGKTANDGDGKNGLFTQELLKHIGEPGLDLEKVFKRVRASVSAKSGDTQMPWDSSSMTGEFYFKPGTQQASLVPVPVQAQPAARTKSENEIEDDTWKAAEGINTPDAYETYLSGYPNGRYAVQAKMKLAALKKPAVNTPQAVSQATLQFITEGAQKGYVSQGGLIWMPATFPKNWTEAESYCVNTTIGGQSGWRLPTKDELSALYKSSAMLESAAFKNHGWVLDETWSSTPSRKGFHYNVFLYRGGVGSGFDKDALYVTCVREQ